MIGRFFYGYSGGIKFLIPRKRKSFIRTWSSNTVQRKLRLYTTLCSIAESTKRILALGAKKKGLPREKEEERGKSNGRCR